MREQRVPLEHGIDRPFVRRQFGDVPAVEQDVSLRRHVKAGNHPQRGRLAAAGRPEEGYKFPALHFQVEVRNRPESVRECP